MKKIALLAMGLLLVCNCAFATTTPLGQVGITPIPFAGSHTVLSTEQDYFFTDNFSFSIAALSDVKALTASFNLPALNYGISGLSFKLFEDSSFSTLITPDTSAGSSNPLIYLYDNLGVDTYFFTVSGTIKAGMTGMYAGSLSAAPVPVPAAAILLGAGLLGIVGIRRRQTV